MNVLEIVVSHRVDEHIKDDSLCRANIDPTIVERPVVCHVTDDFIDDMDEKFHTKAEQTTNLIMCSYLLIECLLSMSTVKEWNS